MTWEQDFHELQNTCRSFSRHRPVLDVPTRLMKSPEGLVRAFRESGFFAAVIDESPIRTEEDLYRGLAESCGWPTSYNNWNAAKDKLLDFSWLDPRPTAIVLIYKRPELLRWSELADFIMLIDVVYEVYRSSENPKPFKLLTPVK